MARRNELYNPSWETGLGRWGVTVVGGGAVARYDREAQTGSILPISGGQYAFALRSTTVAGRVNVYPFIFTPVAPGETWTASIWVNRDGTGSATLDIDWYSGNGTGYLDSATTIINPASGTWARIAVTATMPAGANYARMFLHFDNMQVNTYFRFDAALFEKSGALGPYFDGSTPGASWTGTTGDSPSVESTTMRRNMVSNPSIETTAAGYVLSGVRSGVTTSPASGATALRSSSFAAASGDAYGYVNITGNGTTGSWDAIVRGENIAIEPSTSYSFSAAFNSSATAGTVAWCGIDWLDSTGTQVGTAASGTAITTTNSWQRTPKLVATAPSDAAYARPTLWARNPSDTTLRSWRFDALLFERTATAAGYFDGSTTGGVWQGAAHNSWSVKNPNVGPTAAAGADRSVTAGDVVNLSGTGSTDPEGDTLTYAWTVQSAGTTGLTTASITNRLTATPSLTPPSAGTATIRLTVTDEGGLTATDDLVLTVASAIDYREGQGVAAVRLRTASSGAKRSSGSGDARARVRTAGGGSKRAQSHGEGRIRVRTRGSGGKRSAGTGWSSSAIVSTAGDGLKRGVGPGQAGPVVVGAWASAPPPIPQFTGRPLPEDPLPLADVRYLVQNILTGEWLHTDLPLSDDQVTITLSGPGAITGKITPEMADLRVTTTQTVQVPLEVPIDTPVDPLTVLTQNGIQNASVVIQAAQIVGLDLARAVTMIQKESGGRHIWGHDPVTVAPNTYTKGGPVTTANYHAFRTARGIGDAAAAILARIEANASIYEDWSWSGMPASVRDYGDQLAARYDATGGRWNDWPRVKAFLAAQVAARPGWNGVGMTQLTFYSYLDQADTLHPDGPADMLTNCRVGFLALKGLQDQHGVQDGARRYNGSGPAAEAYAADYMAKLVVWQQRLAATSQTTTVQTRTETVETEAPLLRSWGHVLYLEMDGEIRAAAMVTEDSYDDQTQTLTCLGVSAYPKGIPYEGNYLRYFADPIDVFADMWRYVQGFPGGNLGVAVERMGGRPPALLGVDVAAPTDGVAGVPLAPRPTPAEGQPQDPDPPIVPVRASNTVPEVYRRLVAMGYRARGGLLDPTKPAGQDNPTIPADTLYVRASDAERAYVEHFQSVPTAVTLSAPPDITSKSLVAPFKVDWWDVKYCGQVADDMVKACPADYVEQFRWNNPRTFVYQTILVGYPRIGRRRDDLVFVSNENIVEPPDLNFDAEGYATCVIGIGAGEGSAALREKAEVVIPGRVRKVFVYRNSDITDRAELRRIVTRELTRRSSFEGQEITRIVVSASHVNAPFGSYNVGDDIPVQVQVPHWGWITQWCRIVSMTLAREDELVELNLRRSDSFFYGREVPS